MSGNEIIKALEEAVEQKKAVCSSYDSALILTRESAEGIIEAYKEQKAEIEKYKKTVVDLNSNITDLIFQKEKAKFEAIKEFAERFDLMLADYDDYDTLHIYEIKDRLDLVKEMEGETK